MNILDQPPPEEPEYKEWVRIVRDYMRQVDRYKAALEEIATHKTYSSTTAKKALNG
jgi:hypothetical protein